MRFTETETEIQAAEILYTSIGVRLRSKFVEAESIGLDIEMTIGYTVQ